MEKSQNIEPPFIVIIVHNVFSTSCDEINAKNIKLDLLLKLKLISLPTTWTACYSTFVECWKPRFIPELLFWYFDGVVE